MQRVGFEWPAWALDALHDVNPAEVLGVLNADRRWPRVGSSETGMRVLTIWGRTRAGRPLMVLVRQLDEWDWQIVGARELVANEVDDLEKWETSR